MSSSAVTALRRGDLSEKRDALHEVAKYAQHLIKQGEVQAMIATLGLAKAEQPKARPGVALVDINPGTLGRDTGLKLQRPVGLQFDQLREVGRRAIIIEGIVATRTRQLLKFLRPSKLEYQTGFRFVFKNDQRRIRDEDFERFTLLGEYLMNCGLERDPRVRRSLKRDNLREFSVKHLEDSLLMDSAPIEIIPTLSGNTHGWKAVDGGCVYLTDPQIGLEDDWNGEAPLNAIARRHHGTHPEDVFAVYAEDGVPLETFTYMDLLYPIRNPTSDRRYYGYGRPEPERLIDIVTAFLNALTVNKRSISDNSIPPGILALFGDYEEEDIEELRADWTAQMSGATNRYRVPVITSEARPGASAQWLPTGGQVSDVLYARWITLLVAIICLLYGINPVEVNFESYTAGQSSLSGSDTEAQLTSGQDKGLYSMVTWFFETLNELVSLVDPDVRVEPTGLEVSREEALAREKDLFSYGQMMQRYGISTEDVPELLLKAPMNPNLQGIYLQAMNMQAQTADPGQGIQGEADGPEDKQGGAQDGSLGDQESDEFQDGHYVDGSGQAYHAEQAPPPSKPLTAGQPDKPLSKAYTPALSMAAFMDDL